MYYYSMDGMTSQGSVLKEFDRCGGKKISKPDSKLGEIIAYYNFDDRMRWFDSISTKEFTPNGRLNTNVIIYKVYER